MNAYGKYLELMCTNGPRRINSLVLQMTGLGQKPKWGFYTLQG